MTTRHSERRAEPVLWILVEFIVFAAIDPVLLMYVKQIHVEVSFKPLLIVKVCLICAVNIDTERSRSHKWLRSRVWIAGTASRQYEACVQDGVWTGCRLQR